RGLRPEEAVPEPDGVEDRDDQDCPSCAGPSLPPRARFEGEHPHRRWSSRRERETPKGGYAPSEYRTKHWPTEALLGGWYPHRTTGDAGFSFGWRTWCTRTDLWPTHRLGSSSRPRLLTRRLECLDVVPPAATNARGC